MNRNELTGWLLEENRDEKVLLRVDMMDGVKGRGTFTASYSSHEYS